MAEPIRFWVLRCRDGVLGDPMGCLYAFCTREKALENTAESVEMVELSAIREEYRVEIESLKARAEKMEKALGAIRDSPVHHRMGRSYADVEVIGIAEEALKP
jgi:hypothetical protein